jgi:hypothetical protein
MKEPLAPLVAFKPRSPDVLPHREFKALSIQQEVQAQQPPSNQTAQRRIPTLSSQLRTVSELR